MKYSINRALAELKLLDGRISRAISESKFVAVQIGSKLIEGYIKTEDFAKNAEASLQQVQALIARRNMIKSKIVASNAVAEVTFPSGKVMKVAEVIERKTSIAYDRQFLNMMRMQYNSVITGLQRAQIDAKAQLEKRIEQQLGKDASKNTDNAEVIDIITKSFNKDNEPKLIDPIGLKKVIDALTADIEEFDHEADFLLSESNNVNSIEIDDQE